MPPAPHCLPATLCPALAPRPCCSVPDINLVLSTSYTLTAKLAGTGTVVKTQPLSVKAGTPFSVDVALPGATYDLVVEAAMANCPGQGNVCGSAAQANVAVGERVAPARALLSQLQCQGVCPALSHPRPQTCCQRGTPCWPCCCPLAPPCTRRAHAHTAPCCPNAPLQCPPAPPLWRL